MTYTCDTLKQLLLLYYYAVLNSIQFAIICLGFRSLRVFRFCNTAALHGESKTGCHPNHGYHFVNSWLICKILSLLQRAVNFQQNRY